MMYQVGWTTLPGLRGLSCSEFRAVAADSAGAVNGVGVDFATDAEREEFLQQLESQFASRRFTNAADAFDTVKAWIQEHTRNPEANAHDHHR